MLTEMDVIHRRNLLYTKIMWFCYIVDLIVNIFVDPDIRIIIAVIFAGGSACIVGTLLTHKKILIPTMYYYTVTMFSFVFLINFLDPSLANYMFFYFTLALVSLYQNYRPLILGTILNILAGIYFWLFKQQMFPGDFETRHIVYCSIAMAFVGIVLISTSIFSEKMRKQAISLKDQAEIEKEKAERTLEQMTRNAKAVADFSNILNEQIEGTSKLSKSIEESFKEMAVAISNQTQSMTSINGSIEKVNTDISTVSSETSEMLSTSDQSKSTARQAKSEVEQLQEEIVQISDTINLTLNLMEELDENSLKILKSTEDIKEINNTINLISLNASIESARIDSSNVQTFSVIAEEIKALAERTSLTTNQIHTIITELIAKTNNVLTVVEKTQGNMGASKATMQKVKDAFENIEQTLEQVVSKSAKIENLTGNLEDASVEIVSSTNDVTAVTEENLSSVEEILGSIRLQNEQMQEIVTKFKELEQKVKV